MGDVTTICFLIPGAQVSVSNHLVSIQMAGTVKFFDALDIEELDPDKTQGCDFLPLVSVRDDAPRPVVLVRCDMRFDGDFTQRTLKFIKQGKHYITTLQGGLPILGKDEETALICDMAYVLDESETGAVLLGVLSADLDE